MEKLISDFLQKIPEENDIDIVHYLSKRKIAMNYSRKLIRANIKEPGHLLQKYRLIFRRFQKES